MLENKLGHVLNNPIQKYAAYARSDGYATVIVAVLAPDARSHLDLKQQPYLSATITYTDLSEEIKRTPDLLEYLLAPADLNQRRSLDLLQQFMEARNGEASMADLANESQRLEEWRTVLDQHGAAIKAFEEARNSIGRMIRDRRKRLEPLIAERFATAGLVTEWESHGGIREQTWNAYYFPEAGWTVELKFSADPAHPTIYVFDRRGNTYKDSTTEPLGLPWIATDEQISDSFVSRVIHILQQAKAGNRPELSR